MKIFFVGLSRCPYANRACDIRLHSFAELFSLCGSDVTILNRYSPFIDSLDKHKSGNYETKELVKQRKSSRLNLLLFVWSILREFAFLINYRIRSSKKVILHVYSGHYADMLFYRFIALLCGYKIIYQYVEYRKDEKRRSLYHRLNGWLVDTLGAKLWDGVIPITHFLNDRALEQNSSLKSLIGPPICDYSQFDKYRVEKNNIVLFCGSAAYFEVIKLVIDSFNLSSLAKLGEYNLELILTGSKAEIDKVKSYYPQAIIKSALPYEELIQEYNKAKILMIPLRNTIKDISRFPNKVCEYAASKSVIVTTKYGEPAHFFEDGVSAMIAEECNVNAIADKLTWLHENDNKIKDIGKNGYKVGLKSFELTAYVDKMKSFLETLNR